MAFRSAFKPGTHDLFAMIDRRATAAGRRRTWPTLLAAFAAYSALAVVLTFPLILNLASRIPKDLEDSLLYPTILWWNAHVMPLTERWWNGFGFFPATGMMAFSEHLLGASLIASPLQWLGVSAITAYNLTFLASFPLCAVAAQALAFTLTKRHDAAIVCGLAYGFNPYRVAHLEHLELLMAFGMPAALAALHLYADTRRAKWLVAFAVALTLQVLSSSYYALFFIVLLGMWIVWFMRPRDWRAVLAVVGAGGLSALAISPIVVGYSRIHDSYNMTRNFAEVLTYSADLSSLATASPLSAVWGWTASLNGGERQLFPGLTITALAVVGAIVSRRSRADDRDRLAIVSNICWVISACFAVIAMGAHMAGPWYLDWGWLRISVSAPYKPLSQSAAFAIGAIALSPTLRGAFRRRSTLAFYLITAAVFFLCSLGPEPAFFGERILYKPPFAWLMGLPFFDKVRVPARFAMLAVLALSVAGSVAFSRLTLLKRERIGLWLVVVAAIVGEGWIRGLPLPAPPSGFRIPSGDRSVAVMELPLGKIPQDTAAMSRVMFHGRRTVNGYNGYEPLYYHVLRLALADRDHTALETLASSGPLLIATDNHVERDERWASFVSNHPGVTRLDEDDNWTFFHLSLRPPPQDRCAGDPVAVTAAFDVRGQIDAAPLTDHNPATRWITPHPQRVGDMLIFELERVEHLCGLVASLGFEAELYPRTLSVATSFDNMTWETSFAGKMGGSAFRAALENPRDARLSIPLRGQPARFVRLRLEQSQPLYPWAVADIIVKRQR